MKITGYGRSPHDCDIVRKIAVGAEQPPSRVTRCVCVEMDDLPGSVNAGIGTSCANDIDLLIGHTRQRVLNSMLHTDTALLPLPAVVRGTVILYAECDTDDCEPFLARQ